MPFPDLNQSMNGGGEPSPEKGNAYRADPPAGLRPRWRRCATRYLRHKVIEPPSAYRVSLRIRSEKEKHFLSCNSHGPLTSRTHHNLHTRVHGTSAQGTGDWTVWNWTVWKRVWSRFDQDASWFAFRSVSRGPWITQGARRWLQESEVGPSI